MASDPNRPCALLQQDEPGQRSPLSASLRVPTTGLEIGRQLGGGKGGGTGLLERTGLDLSQSSQEFSAKTDDTGGDGGNGNGIKNGGGGGDGDEGDDDEYRDDGDDEVRGRTASREGHSLLQPVSGPV